MIKNFIYRYYFRFRRPLTVLVVASFLLLLIVIPVSSKLSDVGVRAAILRDHPGLTKLLPVYWAVRKISDIIYLPYIFKKDKIPAYELIIPPDSRKKIDDSLPKAFSNVTYTNKVWAPAEFKANGKTYKVEVRYRGENAVHWNAPKKSYLVKFNKDDLFNGVRQLSFIIADDRLFALEELNNYRADKLGLLRPESGFANLKINGKNNGLYFTIESWTEEMLAKWETPDQTNFYDRADQNTDSPVTVDYNIWDNLDRWDKSVSDQRFNYDHYTEIFKLLDLLNNSSDREFYESIFNLIDKNNFYAWQVHQELIHSNHQNNDVRLLFDNTAGKFFFTPWDLGNSPPSMEIDMYSHLAQRIFSNPIYWYEKDKLLYGYVNNKDNLQDDLNFYDEKYELIKTSLYKDRLKIYTNRWADSLIAQRRQHIIDAFNKVKDRFENNLTFVDVGLIDDNSRRFGLDSILAFIDINTKSYSALWLKPIEARLTSGEMLPDYQLYYDSNSNQELDSGDKLVNDLKDIILYTNRGFASGQEGGELLLTKHRFYLVSGKIMSVDFSDQLEDFEVDLENAVTAGNIKKADINTKIINQSVFKYFDNISNVNKFRQDNPFFLVNEASKEIFLPFGSYRFTQTVIIPRGYTLRIAPGTSLFLGPEVSIVSYSNVIAEGLPGAPIRVSRLNAEEPWGAFAVLNSSRPSRFNFFNADGGKDAYVNGVFFIGMVSIYHNEVTVASSQFTNSLGDDGLNVKSAKAEITGSFFIGNSFDGLDMDFVKEGSVKTSQFIGNGNDGIDLSGSTILIADNRIQGSGDKCISVGEKSLGTIIYNNILDSCGIGIEIKDLSDILIINNVIINNQIGLNAYQKKPVFGGGLAKVYNSIIWDNQDDVKTDPQSGIDVFNSNINRDDLDNNNFNTPPEFADLAAGDYRVNSSLYQSRGNNAVLEKYLDLKLDQAPVGLIK